MDFDIIAPGHGGLIRDKEHIDHFQAYLKDIWRQVVAMKKDGLRPVEIAEKVDMTRHSRHFPSIKGPGADLRGILRMLKILENR